MATSRQISGFAGLALPDAPTAYRYERKFTDSTLSVREIEFLIKTHPALFRTAYPKRWVNNIYFDDPDLGTYAENVVGNSSRYKVRIRWYGSCVTQSDEARLEIKLKQGFLGTKRSFDLPPLTFAEGFRSTFLKTVLAGADVPPMLKADLESFRPTVLNRYLRRYYLSADGRFRVTVDTAVAYFPARPAGRAFSAGFRDDASVIEVKYGFADSEEAERITSIFPFRLVRNSKYVNAVQLIHQ